VRSRLYTQVSGRGGATRLKRVPPLSNFAHVPGMRRVLLLLGWQSSGTPPCDRSNVRRRPQTSQPPTDPTDSWSADTSPRNYTRRSCAPGISRMILKSDYTIKKARIRVVVFLGLVRCHINSFKLPKASSFGLSLDVARFPVYCETAFSEVGVVG
jgi:hypothetical protein